MTAADSRAEAVLDADLCVVGGGPAGLGLVQALLGRGLRIVLLEAGDDRTARPMPDIRITREDPYLTPEHVAITRANYLGGTSGFWSYRMSNDDPEGGERGCRYAPMDPIDFETRDDVPHGGWPFGRAELDPWYAAAQPVSGLGPYDYTPGGWATGDAVPLDLDPAVVETQMFQFASESVWTRGVVGRLRADPDVRIVLDAAVTELVTDGGSSGASTVTAVRYRRPDGSEAEVRAARVVLAAGGIENSRLLLLGEAGERGELGNAHDQVGRFWMEHPLIRGGMLVTPRQAGFVRRLGLYDATWRDGTKVMAKLSITPDWMRKEGLVSTSCLFLPRDDVHATAAVQAYSALRSPSGRAATAARKAGWALDLLTGPHHLLRARRIFPRQTGVDHNGWSAGTGVPTLRVFELLHQSEQTPDPDNRILLGTDRDRFGRRIPELQWRWSEDDRDRIRRSRDTYAAVFERAGIGRVIQTDWDRGRPRMVGGNHHHIGGTRIATDPRHGVVDADLKVHGTTNLFVTGSSVFPSGGSVNPTLTIVALSLRLAAQLDPRAV